MHSASRRGSFRVVPAACLASYPNAHPFQWHTDDLAHTFAVCCLQVAELAIVSLEKGHYLVRAPDIFSNLIVAAGANIAPRMFPIFLEFLLVPFYLLLYVVGGRTLNRRILRWRQSGKAKAS